MNVTDGGGEVDIDGPGSSDYDDPPDDHESSGIDTHERRMAPDSVLSRPGLLAGPYTICDDIFSVTLLIT